MPIRRARRMMGAPVPIKVVTGVHVITVHWKESAMGFVRRRARRRTALVVGGLAGAAGYEAGKNRGREQGYDQAVQYEPQQPAAPPAAPALAPSSGIDYDELKRLAELHAAGTLSDDEFAAAKAKILGIEPSSA
jgi:hypothetical protein